MTSLVRAYQNIILYGTWPDFLQFKYHLLGAILAMIAGFFVFHRLADEMVDEL